MTVFYKVRHGSTNNIVDFTNERFYVNLLGDNRQNVDCRVIIWSLVGTPAAAAATAAAV